MKKRLLSLLMVLCLMLTLAPVALAAEETWTADETWYASDSEKTEYTISTAEQLAGLASLVNAGAGFSGKTVTLDADINLAGKLWIPIGTLEHPFEGTFNGGNHAITGLTFNDSSASNVGLFGAVKDAVLKNVTLKDVDITAGECVGALTGHMWGSCTVSGVSASGQITGGKSTAGIIGIIRDEARNDAKDNTANGNKTVEIRDCVSVVTITATGKTAGIVAHVQYLDTTFTNCENHGSITATMDGMDGVVAGIVGYVMRTNNTVLTGCSNTGNLTLNDTNAGKPNVGGIISTAHQGDFQISDCSNSGSITVTVNSWKSNPTKTAVGGICGSTSQAVTMTNCTNSGTISAENRTTSGNVSVGGMFGYNDGGTQNIIACTNSGTLTASGGDSQYTGGLVGYLAKAANVLNLANNECGGDAVGGMNSGATVQNVVAECDGTYYTDLKSAIDGAQDGGTVTLLGDVALTDTITIAKNLTIDLSGNDITSTTIGMLFDVTTAKLTLMGEGTLDTSKAPGYGSGRNDYYTIRVQGGTDSGATGYGLDVQSEVSFNSNGYAVQVKNNTSGATNAYGVTVNLYCANAKAAYSVATVNGSMTGTEGNVPVVNMDGVNVTGGGGLYAAGYAKYNIKNSTLSGEESAVEIRAGIFNIESGTFSASATPTETNPNGSGTTTTGAAIAVAQHNTKLPINVTINGGDISGYSALYQSNPQNNSEEDIAKVSIAVNGGNFKAINGGKVSVYSENKTGFISGGTFSTDPSDYVAQNYIVRKDSDTSYTVVAKENLTSGVYMSDPSSSVASGYVVSGSGPYTVSVYIPTTTTTTTTNDDGSKTTTTTDKSTGATTETTTSQPVTDEAGNTTQTTTETVTKKDGSTTETVTETVKAADGSTATKVTETNGAGETSTTVEATVSTQAVTQATGTDTAVTIPVAVTAVKAEDSESAAVVTVNVPSAVTEDNTVQVEIPVENLTTGTVAVVVNADGTEEIIKTSTLGEEGVVLTLEGDATVKIVDNSKTFEDVHPVDHWAEDAVTYVAAREIFNGTGTSERNTFSPDEDLTRAMLMTVLARYDGEDTSGGDNWYEQGMNWAMQTGVSDGTNPKVSITREEMVTMLWRYAGKPESSHALDFSDAHDINDWAEEAMRWAVSTGIINGVGNNTLDPQGPATRAQVATVMMRFCENIAK